MTVIFQHMLESLKQETGSKKENYGFEIFALVQRIYHVNVVLYWINTNKL